MKNRTKGFTLIELLAVIVILAVIALIATPIVMNVINDAKKGSAKDSMYAYVKAVELATTKDIKPDNNLLSGTYTTTDGNLYSSSNKILDIDLKGTKPSNNVGNVVIEKGLVKRADLTFDRYCIGYDGNKASVKDECTNKPTNYEIGDTIYFDPTGTVTNCVAGKEWTETNSGTTCYKWNIVKVNSNNVEMLLDHNTSGTVVWNNTANNATGPKEVYDKLKTDTASWNKVETLTSSDNVVRDGYNRAKYTINYTGMKARLISGQEVADIGKDTLWTPSNYTGTEYSASSWLYQNLSSFNTDTKPYAYWTDTAHLSNFEDAWGLYYMGSLGNNYSASDGECGVRPVVRVLKSNI